MQSLWDDKAATACNNDPLALRVYSSRLIGREADLVLHGGGNTSVKTREKDLFGDTHETIHVKGSGWDLVSIEAGGFAPLRLDALIRLSQLPTLSDPDMVRSMRAALLDPSAPNPSVEAILHAIIPFKFVDHSHADAVVTLTNTQKGEKHIHAVYGQRVLVMPYVMPGFELAKKFASMTRDIDWTGLEGMVLMGHGLFTFADDVRQSYERMIGLVTEAEQYIQAAPPAAATTALKTRPTAIEIASLRRAVSRAAGFAMLARFNDSPEARGFAGRNDAAAIATRGPLTPDHVIRTKRLPLIVDKKIDAAVSEYIDTYVDYFNTHATDNLTRLDPAPRWALWPGAGTVAFGRSMKETAIVADIVEHTATCIQNAERLGGWKALTPAEIFAVEYWELEQAKLKKGTATLAFQGKVALVTGGGNGIGKASVQTLLEQGAAVAALDIDPAVEELFAHSSFLGLTCDVGNGEAIEAGIAKILRRFGGIDIVVSNAGIFTAGATIAEMNDGDWERSLNINLSATMRLLRACTPYLELGIDPAVVIVGSKNVPAPGRAAGAYSVAKAGLTQLARVAALELAESGIRVNTVHPNAVFDTGIWTDEVLAARAARYGLTVEQYKTNNLLATEVVSRDVARMVCAMAGEVFAKSTGTQVPVDGGTERVV